MTGADTNLVVRFLVRDNELQAQKVKKLLDEGQVLYINEVVLSELYWVLVHVYGYSKNDFVRAVDALLETKGFLFFNGGTVRRTLADYIHSTAGFSDCLIHQLNCNETLETLTYDKAASRLKNMKLMQ